MITKHEGYNQACQTAQTESKKGVEVFVLMARIGGVGYYTSNDKGDVTAKHKIRKSYKNGNIVK